MPDKHVEIHQPSQDAKNEEESEHEKEVMY